MSSGRAREWYFHWACFGGGLTFYPYQIAFGLTLRYWPGLFAPSVRLHIGPFKAWIYVGGLYE